MTVNGYLAFFIFSQGDLRQDKIDRFGQIGEFPYPPRREPYRLPLAVPSHDQERSATGPLARFDIGCLVADHEGTFKIDIVLHRRTQEHSWTPFAAVTLTPQIPYPLGRMVRAYVKRIDSRTELSEFFLQVAVQGLHLMEFEVASRYTGLVGHHDDPIPRLTKSGNGQRSTGNELEVLDPVEVILLDVDSAIAIEEYRGYARLFRIHHHGKRDKR